MGGGTAVSYTHLDGEPEILDKEWEYECLQYNNLAENGNRLNWFFVPESGE